MVHRHLSSSVPTRNYLQLMENTAFQASPEVTWKSTLRFTTGPRGCGGRVRAAPCFQEEFIPHQLIRDVGFDCQISNLFDIPSTLKPSIPSFHPLSNSPLTALAWQTQDRLHSHDTDSSCTPRTSWPVLSNLSWSAQPGPKFLLCGGSTSSGT